MTYAAIIILLLLVTNALTLWRYTGMADKRDEIQRELVIAAAKFKEKCLECHDLGEERRKDAKLISSTILTLAERFKT